MAEVKLKWVEGLQFVGNPPSNHAVLVDGGPAGGGIDSAAHPRELLLVALGGCTGMDVVSLLRKMRQDFHELEIRIRAEFAEEHPQALRRAHLTFFVRGRELEEDKVRKAITLSQEKYCAVAATLRPTVEITWELELAPPR